METLAISSQRVAVKSGLMTCICLIAYFLLMKFTGLIHITELRAVNFFILLGGIFFAFRYYTSGFEHKVEYLKGLLFGCTIAAFSVIPFAIFLGLYFSMIDPHLLGVLKANAPMMGEYISPLTAAGTIVLEGMCSGVIITFFLIQYYQSDPKKS